MRRKHLLSAFALLTALAIVLLLVFVQPGVHEIEYVIPNGYSGPVIVREAPDGVVLEHLPAERKYIARVGPDGQLQLKDAKPLRLWHTLSIRYEAGASIPHRRVTDQAEDEFAWWEGYEAEENEFVGFIGQLEDAKAFYESRR